MLHRLSTQCRLSLWSIGSLAQKRFLAYNFLENDFHVSIYSQHLKNGKTWKVGSVVEICFYHNKERTSLVQNFSFKNAENRTNQILRWEVFK